MPFFDFLGENFLGGLFGDASSGLVQTGMSYDASRRLTKKQHEYTQQFAPGHYQQSRDDMSSRIDLLRSKGATLPEILGQGGGASGGSPGPTMGNAASISAQQNMASQMRFQAMENEKQRKHEQELKDKETGLTWGTLSSVQKFQTLQLMSHAFQRFPVELKRLQQATEAERHSEESARVRLGREKTEAGLALTELSHRDPKLLADRYSNLFRSLSQLADSLGLDPSIVQALAGMIGGTGAAAAFQWWLSSKRSREDREETWHRTTEQESGEGYSTTRERGGRSSHRSGSQESGRSLRSR